MDKNLAEVEAAKRAWGDTRANLEKAIRIEFVTREFYEYIKEN